MNAIIDAHSGSVRLDLGRWSSPVQPPEGALPRRCKRKASLVYSDETFGEVENGPKDQGGGRAIENSVRNAPKFKVGDSVRVTNSAIRRLTESSGEYIGREFTVIEIIYQEHERPELDTPAYYIRGRGPTDSVFYEDELEFVLDSDLP
jgi:hypothetical protein